MNFQETREGFRLSPQQRLRWRAKLPAPSVTLDIEGPLDPQWLHHTLAALVARHESLRLDLQPSPGLGVPLQVIGDRGTAAQRIQWDEEGQGAATGEQTGISARLETLETGRQCLHLRLPPLGADRGTLLRLVEALAAPPAGEPDSDAMSYNQYASWLYELQADEDADEGRRHWVERGALDQSSGELPYRERRSDGAGSTVATLPAGPEFDRALGAFCAASGHAPDEVLITTWGLLLQRLATGSEEEAPRIPLNWIHDCRDDYDELADCWGLFSRGLPLAWDQPLAGSFGDALVRMRHCREEATEWQEYYAVDSDPEAASCRYGFEWGGELAAHCLGELRVEVVELQAQTQPFELLLVPERILVPEGQGSGYRLSLYYDAGCYSQRAAITLLEQYRSLSLDALAAPSQPLRSLSLHSPDFARRLQTLEAPQPLPALGQDDLFPACFSRRASEFGDAIALCDRERDGAYRRLSYRELETRSNRLAHHLRSRGLGPESRVALYLERSAEILVAMLAVLKSGAAFLPLEPVQPAARTLAMLEAATPALILGSGTGQPPCPPGVAHLDLDTIGPLADCPDTPPEVVLDPDNAAYVLFTSGSTGTPKGVVVAHRQLYHYVNSILVRLDLQAGAKSALATSLAADLSYTLLFPALLSGGELHLIDRDTALDPQAWATYQGCHAIDNLKIVPSLLDAWLDHSAPAAVLPRHQLILGGETCPSALLTRIRAAAPTLEIYNHYGPTEATIGVLMHRLDPALDYRLLPLSDRLDHMRIHLLDSELEPVACGQPGELYIAGPQLARGYLCPDQTAERFLPNPFAAGERLYRTGDLARYRPDGAIELIGRADRQVKIRGFRIELGEIESLLSSLPAVRRAAVVAAPRPQGDLRLFAFVSPEPTQSLSIARLQGQLQDRLPEPMLPTLRLVEELPLLANGKLDRQTLCAQAGKMLDQACSTPPRTPLEELLADLWAEVLGLGKVGVDDDFFALGGHSLAAVKLASRLQQSLSAPVTVNAVFSAPTVARFAKLVQRELQLSSLVNLSPAIDKGPTLFCFHPSTGHVQDYRPLAGPLAPWRLWGLQADYLTGGEAGQSLDALAAGYMQQLRRQQPTGPYYLLGWSLGGLLALSTAAKLESIGETVAFVGVVDSQLSTDEPAEQADMLLQALDEELEADSRARLRQLPPHAREQLVRRLQAAERDERPFLLVQWAEQQGLQLNNDSWQHMQMRLQHRRHTQRLIRSFKPSRLNRAPTVWWAAGTLNADATAPVDWQRLTGSPAAPGIIDADHMTILKQPIWQRQLRDALQRAQQASAHRQCPSQTSAILNETI